MKKTKVFSILMLVVFVCSLSFLFTPACKNEKPKEPEIIKIGAILPLSGNLSFMGVMEKDAMTLAEKTINEENLLNGKKIKVIFGDSKGQAKDGANIAQQFINAENIKIIITSLTGVSYAVQPITLQNKVLHIAFCMDPDISKKSDYTFRLYEGMWEEGEKIMEYLSNDKSNSKTGIIYVRIPATEIVVQNVFLPYLKKQNKEIACIESYEFGNKDFKNIILKIKHSLPKHLIIYDYGFNFPILFDELNTQGILGKTEIIGGWGFLYSLMTKQMDLKLLDGVVVAGPSFIVKKNANADIFIKKFKNTFNYEPNFDGAFAYESIMILSTALKETTSDRIEELIKSLKNKEFTGITGKIKINNNRDLIADMVIGIIRDGVIQPIDLEKNEK